MPELTPENMKVFNRSAEQRFIEKAKVRVMQYMGESNSACFSDEQIHDFTLLGIKNARGHNLISEGEIYDYLWLMVKFGAWFDQDEHFDWLYQFIDGDPDNLMQGRTIHGVSAGKNYLQVIYQENSVWLDVFERLKKNYLKENMSRSDALKKAELESAMKSYNPDNTLILNGDLLERVYSRMDPGELQIISSSSQIIWFILTIDLGYRFYDNPLFPEIRGILKSQVAEKEKIIQILDLKIQCIQEAIEVSDQ